MNKTGQKVDIENEIKQFRILKLRLFNFQTEYILYW